MTRKTYIAAALLAPAVLIFAQATKAPAPKAPKTAAAAEPKGGDITGKVIFAGTPPKPKTLKMDADPVCAAQHPEPVLSKDVVVNPDSTLQNVLVYVKAGLPASMQAPTPTTPVKVDQKGCIYEPRVVVAMVNQPIEFTNSDNTDHHIQAMAEINKEWMVSQNKGTGAQVKTFDQVEVGMLVICHLHPWMRMFVNVLKNQYYAITGPDGTFTIKGLPAGYYTLEAWHEKLGTQTLKVQPGGKADFTFKDE
jgi:plastocyanin